MIGFLKDIANMSHQAYYTTILADILLVMRYKNSMLDMAAYYYAGSLTLQSKEHRDS